MCSGHNKLSTKTFRNKFESFIKKRKKRNVAHEMTFGILENVFDLDDLLDDLKYCRRSIRKKKEKNYNAMK